MTHVYAIFDGEAVKVGKTVKHPEVRRKQLQTGNHRTLRLLAHTTVLTESHAHARLVHWRLGGEWFRLTAGLLAEVGNWSWVDRELHRELCVLVTGAEEMG